MRWLQSLALLLLACGRVDDSPLATPETGGHSEIQIPAATGGVAVPQGGVTTGRDGFGGIDSGGAAPSSGGSAITPTHSGGVAAADGGTFAGGGMASSIARSAAAGGDTTLSTAPDTTYPIVEVPATCANYPADFCGYASDGFGNVIYCGPCPCTVTCEELCASPQPNGVPRCVTDFDAASGYTLECAKSTGCNDGHLRRCWCPRT